MSLTEKAYRQIKADIITGHIKAGSDIDAREIAAAIGVSKTPVREALLRLANEGVVEVNSRRGIRVVAISAARLKNLYQVITAIEVEAVGLMAAQSLTKEDMKSSYEQGFKMRLAIEIQDEAEWNLADEGFHRSLLQLSGNPEIAEAGCYYRDLAQRAHFVALKLVPLDQKAKSIEAHFDLLKLISMGDPQVCRNLHREQRERGGDLLVASLEKLGVDHF